MPLIALARLLLCLTSWLLIAAVVYLLWTWNQGYYVRDVEGVLHHMRDDWRLWTGLALLAWSFGGGMLLLRPFLARGDTDPLDSKRQSSGTIIAGTDGASLYIEMAGRPDRPTIILTHGWGLDSTIWNYAKRDLSMDFHVITWDLPTMGKSKAPVSAVALEAFARNLKAVVRHSGSDRVVLAGHSIGGMALQTLVRDDPDFVDRHVAGLILVNTTYRDPLTTMIFHKICIALRFPVIEPGFHLTKLLWPLAWLSAWKSYLDGSAHVANRLGFGKFVTHSQLGHTTLLTIRNSQRGQAKGNLAMFGWDAEGTLTKSRAPILVLGGDLDLVTKPEASTVIARSAPKAELKIIEGVNHMGFLERADIYNAAIADFAAQSFAQDAKWTGAAQ